MGCSPTFAFVAGCPSRFDCLSSGPYLDINRLHFGHPAVVSDAHRHQHATKASTLFSCLIPSIWYASCQTYIPYADKRLDGRKVIKDVLANLLAAASQLSEEQENDRQYRRRVWRLLLDMHGDQKWYSLRFGCWLLSHIFKWLFNGEIFVNTEVCRQLRDMAPSSTFVYVPTHKSHLDYHMLSYVLFSEGLACPHIAAGDNLNLPVVGRIMRTCGAFFIRRSIKSSPDAALYKRTLDAYLESLLAHGAPIEFFIEGGRARDGRIAPPKLGLLTSAVETALSNSAKGTLTVVPVAISYDFPLEEQGLLHELLGQRKRRESVLQFVSAFSKLLLRLVWGALAGGMRRPLGAGGTRGRVAVTFAAPIPVRKFLKERSKRRRKRHTSAKSKLDLLHVDSNDVTFDQLIDIASRTDAASVGGSSGGSAAPPDTAGPSTVAGGPQDAVALALPAGSSARRAAVAALGNDIHLRLLRSNVVPVTALLSAALLPELLLGQCSDPAESADAGRPARIPQPQHTRAVSPVSPSLSLATLERRYRWVQRQLTAHNVPFMPLPTSTHPSCRCATPPEFLLSIANACAPHVSVAHEPRAKGGCRPPGGPAGGGPVSVFLSTGPEAVLWQHTRLNMLLPATAAAATAVCGLAIAAAGRPSAEEEAVVRSTMWLRGLLSPDLNAALGVDTMASQPQVQAELARLVQMGQVLCHSPASSPFSSPTSEAVSPINSSATSRTGLDVSDSVAVTTSAYRSPNISVDGQVTNGSGSRSPIYSFADNGRRELAFHVATLAPLIATYASALKFACARLSGAAPVSRAELSADTLSWLCGACQERTSAVGAVPSQLLVQHALEALADEGCLFAQGEEQLPSPMPHAVSTINLEPAASASSLAGDSPEPPVLSVASGGPSPRPLQAAGGSASMPPVTAREDRDGGAVKGGIAAAKGGTLQMTAREAATAERTLTKLLSSFAVLQPLEVVLPDPPQ